jgi:hypothetical protein
VWGDHAALLLEGVCKIADFPDRCTETTTLSPIASYHQLSGAMMRWCRGAMMRWAFLFALTLAAVTPAAANPIDTTLALTGAPGAWVYSLDITNNTALSVFEVDVPRRWLSSASRLGWYGRSHPHRGGLLQRSCLFDGDCGLYRSRAESHVHPRLWFH